MYEARENREGASHLWTGLTVVVVLVVSGLMGWLFLRANTGPGAGGVAPKPALFERTPATLDDALAEAGANGLVLAFATADWCPPCQHMKRTALVDPAVETWVRENAVAVYIDTDHNQSDAERLNVRGIPQTTLLRGDGTVLMREVGAMSAEQLLAAMRGAANK